MPLFNRNRNRDMQDIETAEVTPVEAVIAPIGEGQISEAEKTRKKYESAKATITNKIIEAFDWYRLQQHEYMTRKNRTQIIPRSAWTLNVIANKHADSMDNIPSANVLPREPGDEGEAKMLKSIIPVVLDQAEFEETWSKATLYETICGTMCIGTFWDASLNNGTGDIAIKHIDMLSLFWEPGITDIQDSANVFLTTAVNNDELKAQYPELERKLNSSAVEIKEYNSDMQSDTSEKSLVVEWYYKKRNANGKTILHYCKYCNNVVLFATENDERYTERGYYDDGQYPFDVGTILPMQNQLTGNGMVDWCKNDQEYIDRLSEAILKNAFANTAPRYLSFSTGNVNEDEMLDYTSPIVHVKGSEASMQPMPQVNIPAGSFNMLQQRIDQLKETSGTRDVATGGTTSGVTAASAIAAMQEAGSKLSRDIISAQYRVYKKVVLKVIERIRQFYDQPRTFRILGDQGAIEFTTYTNANLQAQPQTDEFGTEFGYRLPLFDIKVEPEKKSPYKKISQNELATQLLQMGIFAPQNADQAAMCVSMMDFDGKDDLLQKITQNGLLQDRFDSLVQKALAMAQTLDAMNGTTLTAQLAQELQAGQGGVPMIGGGNIPAPTGGEAKNTRAARQRVAESTSPV